jgi:secondary thiamine-phosphate synthase enzyme
MIHMITIDTSERDVMIDITHEITQLIEQENIIQGCVVVYSPHTTAGIVINENADPDVKRDVLMQLNEIYPWEHSQYRHAEGNTAAHLKAITTGTSQTVFIDDGRLLLGRWQGIYFCEFDGPRQRTCLVKFIKD